MAKKTLADELRSLAQQMTDLAGRLEAETAKEPDRPEKEISYTDVRKLLAEKSKAGHTEEVRQIIRDHGAEKLSGLDPKEYAAVVREAEVL